MFAVRYQYCYVSKGIVVKDFMGEENFELHMFKDRRLHKVLKGDVVIGASFGEHASSRILDIPELKDNIM